MYERIVFDIDGTLIDSEKAVRLSLCDLIREEWGEERSPGELVFSFGVPGVQSLRELGFSDPEAADRRWSQLLQGYFAELSLFEGVHSMLDGLRNRKIPLGLLTSKTRAEYRDEFVPFGLSSCFEGYICADDTQRHKPDPEPMFEYFTRYGGEPGSTLYVGDSPFDSACAHAAGVDFALACWGAHQETGINARFYPRTPEDLLDILIQGK